MERRPSVASRDTPRSRTTVGAVDNDEARKKKRSQRPGESLVGRIVNNKFFTAITIILTIYALCGEDLKQIFTEKPADDWFMLVTIFCMVIFVLEIILSSLAKDDYFLSFFMILDVVSTASLILDLPPVSEEIRGDEEELENIRGSRTAKIGARLGRVVRVLRLVRILKLYKAVYEARQARRKRAYKQAKGIRPGHQNDWDDDETIESRTHTESRVGKRLSELTIRRVICLVLLMMFIMPLLKLDLAETLPTSAEYGADLVHGAFRENRANATEKTQQAYENTLLKYIYYHNWFTGSADACPHDGWCSRYYLSNVFWIGIAGSNEDAVIEVASLANISALSVRAFEETKVQPQLTGPAWHYNYGSMPEEVQTQILGSSWNARCDTSSGSYTIRRLGISLLERKIDDFNGAEIDYTVRCPEDLRRAERKMYAPYVRISEDEFREWHFVFYFDLRPFVKEDSLYSLGMTGFVIVALLVASVAFTNDANKLVLHPVEKMISKVDTIRSNPLLAMKVADEDFKAAEIARRRLSRNQQPSLFNAIAKKVCCSPEESTTELMETVILERTIIKLGSLLALGFGEAGCNIIESNLHGIDSANVDAMIDGTRVECIIGTIRIRDFSSATEVLQARVMTFVNQIAEIVHGVVDELLGAANKNNGDIFLIIWRTADLELKQVSKLADMSVLAFAKILGAVHRSPVLAAYRSHPALQQRLGKNCRVNVTFGLHFGWAIEGAVGSEFKIDASYLSPNVSIATSIERATQIYSVSFLVTEAVVRICTPGMRDKCRLIDRVKLTGAPLNVYVVDLDFRSLPVEGMPSSAITWTPRKRFRVRQFLEQEKTMKQQDDVNIVSLFEENSDIAMMRFRFTLEFFHIFNMGYQNYSQGEWQVAQRLLGRTKMMLGVEDGPSAALLQYMEKPHGFTAPVGWQGVRELSQGELL